MECGGGIISLVCKMTDFFVCLCRQPHFVVGVLLFGAGSNLENTSPFPPPPATNTHKSPKLLAATLDHIYFEFL